MNQQVSIRELSAQDFLMLGINDIAYVKKVHRDDHDVFTIFSADGGEITSMDNHDVAFATVRQNGLEPLSVH